MIVELQPLETKDTEAYLTSATPPHERGKWISVFTRLHEDPDGPLARALSTPLMTSLARTAYCETTADPSNLVDHRICDRDGIEDLLINQLIPAVYDVRPRPHGSRTQWTAQQAEGWLRHIALHLDRLGTPRLVWWQMHQAMRSMLFRTIFALAGGTMIATATILVGLVAYHPGPTPIQRFRDATLGIMFALAAGFAVKVAPNTFPNIPPPGKPSTSVLSRAVKGLAGGLIGGLAYGLADISIDGPVRGIIWGLEDGILVGLIVGFAAAAAAAAADDFLPSRARPPSRGNVIYFYRTLGTGVAAGLAMGCLAYYAIPTPLAAATGMATGFAAAILPGLRRTLSAPNDVARAISPSAVYRTDRATAIAHAVLSGILGGAAIGAAADVVTGPSVTLGFALSYGFIFTAAAVVFTAWWRFLIVRCYLSCRGYLPWRTMAFLSDAHDRGILRQVGAVYELRHARLQNHLAHDPHDQ